MMVQRESSMGQVGVQGHQDVALTQNQGQRTQKALWLSVAGVLNKPISPWIRACQLNLSRPSSGWPSQGNILNGCEGLNVYSLMPVVIEIYAYGPGLSA